MKNKVILFLLTATIILGLVLIFDNTRKSGNTSSKIIPGELAVKLYDKQ